VGSNFAAASHNPLKETARWSYLAVILVEYRRNFDQFQRATSAPTISIEAENAARDRFNVSEFTIAKDGASWRKSWRLVNLLTGWLRAHSPDLLLLQTSERLAVAPAENSKRTEWRRQPRRHGKP